MKVQDPDSGELRPIAALDIVLFCFVLVSVALYLFSMS